MTDPATAQSVSDSMPQKIQAQSKPPLLTSQAINPNGYFGFQVTGQPGGT